MKSFRLLASAFLLTFVYPAHHALAQAANPNYWDGVQKRETSGGQPTDFKFPIKDNNGVWHVTLCADNNTLELPIPKGMQGSPTLDNDPNGGSSPHAKWRVSINQTGADATNVVIESRSAGENDLQVTFKDKGGNSVERKIHVRIIECTGANAGHRGITTSGNTPDTGGVLLPMLGIGFGVGHGSHGDRSHDHDDHSTTPTDKSGAPTDKSTTPTDKQTPPPSDGDGGG